MTTRADPGLSARTAVLRWYRSHRRDLPWRRDVSPYRTWVSEVMLQQTTVATALPYYGRFLKRFPDVAALAAAREEDVLAAWAGLGYYSRARNLYKAAKEIVSDHGGKFPDRFEDVLDLPGIGRYTAGAILSIACGRPYPVVDGNVMRVFARLYALRLDPKSAEGARRYWEIAQRLVPEDAPGDWNQALMELGATVCTPEGPACGSCPASGHCLAFKKGLQDRLPEAAARPGFVALRWTCLWIEKDGKVLLWKRSPEERFLKNHWSLPEPRHVPAEIGERLKIVRHTITHHKITVDVRRAAVVAAPAGAAWVPREDLKERLVSSLWMKCLPA